MHRRTLGLLARIRLGGSVTVIAEAQSVQRTINEQLVAESIAPEQIRELKSKSDPLKGFGEACRAESDNIDCEG